MVRQDVERALVNAADGEVNGAFGHVDRGGHTRGKLIIVVSEGPTMKHQ